MLVAITPAEIPRLLEALGEQFHADDQAFHRAIRDRSSVNVIHLPTATKIDLFVMGGSAVENQQMSRRRKIQVERSRMPAGSRRRRIERDTRSRQAG